MALKGPDFIGSMLKHPDCKTGKDRYESEDPDSVPWTFNQILMPIILVLTFVIFTQILGYKSAVTKLQRVIGRDTDATDKAVLIINYQLQKLLKAFEQAKQGTLIDFNAWRFPDATVIKCNGVNVDDVQFQIYCKKIYDLSYSDSFNEQVLKIYLQVLQRADLKDPQQDQIPNLNAESFELREITRKDIREMRGKEYASAVGVETGIIHKLNRQIIHYYINDFLHGLLGRAETIQFQLLRKLFDKVQRNPQLIPMSSESEEFISANMEKMVHPQTNEKDRDRLAHDIYMRIVNEWQTKFANDRYPIRESVWDALKM